MFQKLTVFETSFAMAVHAGRQQALVAQNVANADTPGYVARAMPSFAEVHEGTSSLTHSPRATRPGHLHGAVDTAAANLSYPDKSSMSPDGNSVSVDREMLRAVDAKRAHDRSLAIYQSALNVLRTSLGRQ